MGSKRNTIHLSGTRAQWQVGQTLRARRCLSPIHEGDLVVVAEVRNVGKGDYRYRLENGRVSNCWCSESDLELPLDMESKA